jgi:hypothetical protein
VNPDGTRALRAAEHRLNRAIGGPERTGFRHRLDFLYGRGGRRSDQLFRADGTLLESRRWRDRPRRRLKGSAADQ